MSNPGRRDCVVQSVRFVGRFNRRGERLLVLESESTREFPSKMEEGVAGGAQKQGR